MAKIMMIYSLRFKIVKLKQKKQLKYFKDQNKLPKHFGFTIKVKFKEWKLAKNNLNWKKIVVKIF